MKPAETEREIVVALVGNPNVGKSTLFNALTGLHQHTGNWPGKTVEVAQGTYRYKGRSYVLVDLPGTYSLLSQSEEERIAAEFLLSKKADCTLILGDATCLARNLTLALQVMQMTDHCVLCVNLLDEARRRHIDVDLRMLSNRLGVPVVGTSASRGAGLDHVKEAIRNMAEGFSVSHPLRVLEEGEAIYTGTANQEVWVRKEPDLNAEKVRVLDAGDPVTIHELLVVKTKEDGENTDSGNEGSSSTTVTTTTYWARVNDGYIYNPGDRLDLDTLDEKTYTVTENDTLNVRDNPGTEGTSVLFKLNKGDQVTVTKLKVVLGNVWGFVECNQGTGWISLRYTTPGAVTIPENKPTEPTKPTTPPIGDNGNTGDGGFVNNSGGYRYTGKVINTNELNVRATASTNSSKTTTLKSGASLVIYETTISEGMAWGRCDAGWVYLYYVDLTPCVEGAVDARVVYQDNTIIYKDVNRQETAGTYARMSVVDIYEIVGEMARTDKGWVSTKDLL